MNICFVLLSYAEEEPAGMERSVAALLEGLKDLNNNVYVLAAGPSDVRDAANTVRLRSLSLKFPATDDDVASAVRKCQGDLVTELENFVEANNIEIICWVDALWGLGFLPRIDRVARSILMVHVVPAGSNWLDAALSAGHDRIIVPSAFVRSAARRLGFSVEDWIVVPNALLNSGKICPGLAERLELLSGAPIRLAARLGQEKGILPALDQKPLDYPRLVQVALGYAPFEVRSGVQAELWQMCIEVAKRNNAQILPSLPWREVPAFFAGASVGIVPSVAETFGLVALECMSVGTPVVAFAVGNLPVLVRDSGVLIDRKAGFEALWKASLDLLNSPEMYSQLSQRGVKRAKEFSSKEIAQFWLEVASQ